MIDTLFEVLVLKSIGITFLLFVLIAIRPLVLKWLNAKVAYGLWLILPIFLVIPISSFETNSSGGFMTFILGQNKYQQSLLDSIQLVSGSTALYSLLIWGIGCFTAITLFSYRYLKLKRSLSEFKAESVDYIVQTLNSMPKERLHIVSSSLVNTPAVFGLVKAYLVLPANFSSFVQKNQQMILQHEMFHLSRHDHRINILRAIMKSLFWFNPLFYLADKYCEADQEISCDFGVLQNSNQENRKAYATALLDTITATQEYKLLSQWKYQSLIKERVKMLKHSKASKWHTLIAAVIAVSSVWGVSNVVSADSELESNMEAIPIEIVQPRYPREAALNGVEGSVKIKFDLNTLGTPKNIRVLKSEPEGVFDEDALKAIAQWKFKTAGGQQDMVYTMEFKME